MISKSKWRVLTWKPNGEDAKELVAPGFSIPSYALSEKEAVPKPVKGPFVIHSNGFGINLLDGDGRLVATFRFRDGAVEHEEALWLAQKCLAALEG